MKKKIITGLSIAIVIVVVYLLFLMMQSGTLSASANEEIKLCEDTTCFYRQSSDECVCPVVTNLGCIEPYELDAPVNIDECNAEGGVWNHCPQCPKGRICNPAICEPSCDKGQVCYYDNPEKELCYDDEDVDKTGICLLLGDEVEPLFKEEGSIACPSGSESTRGLEECRIVIGEIDLCIEEGSVYNRETERCELHYDSSDVCADGGAVTYDLITLKDKCFNTDFRDTPLVGDVYDSDEEVVMDVRDIDNVEGRSEEPADYLVTPLITLGLLVVALLVTMKYGK